MIHPTPGDGADGGIARDTGRPASPDRLAKGRRPKPITGAVLVIETF
jgi:hypothetical protein